MRARKILDVLRDDQAAEIAESALVLPLTLIFLLGIIYFSRAYNIYSTVTYAAHEGAQTFVQQGCATCGVTAPTPGTAQARVAEVLRSAYLDPNLVSAYEPIPAPTGGACPGGMKPKVLVSGVTVFQNAQLNATTSAVPSCGVVLSFQYPFTFFYMPFTPVAGKKIFLKGEAQIQAEN